MKIPKDLRPLAKAARAQGWVIEHTRNGHLAWRSPAGVTVYTPSTPSDHRGVLNTRRDLRRHGLAA